MKNLLLCLFILCILSCSSNSKNKLDVLLETVDIPDQEFKFSSDTVQTLVGEKGTIITIDPKDLQFENREEVKGEITLLLKELTTKEELLRANAQTISDDKWLISGGAYNIRLYVEEKELQLKKDAFIEVEFPKIMDDDMQLFYGDSKGNGNMNWNKTATRFKDKKYQTIFFQDSSFIMFNNILKIDEPAYVTLKKKLNRRSVKELQEAYPRVDSLSIKMDTIYAYEYCIYRFLDETYELDIKDLDSIKKEWEGIKKRNKRIDEVYQKINLFKLGWVNVDKFYPETIEKVLIRLDIDREKIPEVFVIDQENNTILNWFQNKNEQYVMEFPKGGKFKIIAFDIKDENVLAVKKTIKTNQSKRISLLLKRIKENQLESYFKED
ncbi:hypothetical protein [Aquimarina algiphila]|uniref:hypothetical protein n=1 Tax=Aquimarina algiphila TaxID=2047982 RepID=UPI00232D9FB2|nr:hypothetical protein [Aquimarina algiphila]